MFGGQRYFSTFSQEYKQAPGEVTCTLVALLEMWWVCTGLEVYSLLTVTLVGGALALQALSNTKCFSGRCWSQMGEEEGTEWLLGSELLLWFWKCAWLWFGVLLVLGSPHGQPTGRCCRLWCLRHSSQPLAHHVRMGRLLFFFLILFF